MYSEILNIDIKIEIIWVSTNYPLKKESELDYEMFGI